MKKTIILLTIIALSVACTKKEIWPTVSVTGFVKLVDESGTEVFDRNDITVAIKGSSSYTKTDKNGKYVFTGLQAGTSYSFDISKDGYGTASSFGYKFIGDQKPGLISTTTLYQVPTIELQSATIQYLDDVITISGQITPTNSFKIVAYANDSAAVSDTHYDYYSGSSIYTGFGYSSFQIGIPLNNSNYFPGTTVYVAVYFYNVSDNGNWDSEMNNYKYSSGKKAGLLKITL